MENIDVGLRVEGSKAFLVRSGNRKEIPRDSVLEVYQLMLGHLAPNRDYSGVTSVRKLLRVIDLECEPDDSDEESEAPAPEPVKAAAKPAARRPGARTVARKTPAKPTPKEDSDDDDDEDSD